jgi:glycosyltransferase involved in cell wall biosynthesis
MKRLRVLTLTSVYPRAEGDPEVPWLRTLMGAIATKGAFVKILAPAWKGLPDHQIEGLDVLRFRYATKELEILTGEEGAPNKMARKPWLKLLAIPYMIMGSIRCIRETRKWRPHVLYANWPFPHTLMAMPASWIFNVPIVSQFYGAELLLRKKSPWIERFLRMAALNSRRNLANSTYTASQVREIEPVQVQIVPHGASCPAPIDEPLPPPEGQPTILFVGRHIERKGVRFLIDAMSHISFEPAPRLVIAGHGDLTEELKAQAAASPAADRIEFPGRVSAEELDALYTRCHVFVLPSIVDSRGDTEGLGTVPLEAYEHLRPVVASRVGGIPDVVKDGATGYLVPPEDPKALAEAIELILRDPEMAAAMASQGRKMAREHFSWDRISDLLLRAMTDSVREGK